MLHALYTLSHLILLTSKPRRGSYFCFTNRRIEINYWLKLNHVFPEVGAQTHVCLNLLPRVLIYCVTLLYAAHIPDTHELIYHPHHYTLQRGAQ